MRHVSFNRYLSPILDIPILLRACMQWMLLTPWSMEQSRTRILTPWCFPSFPFLNFVKKKKENIPMNEKTEGRREGNGNKSNKQANLWRRKDFLLLRWIWTFFLDTFWNQFIIRIARYTLLFGEYSSCTRGVQQARDGRLSKKTKNTLLSSCLYVPSSFLTLTRKSS